MSRVTLSAKLAAAFAGLLLVAADDGGCNGTKSIGGNDPPVEPTTCGEATCAEGEICCDASCGLCAADCSAEACPAETCGETTCGEGEACCDDTCCLPAGTTCSPEACQPDVIPCGESMCDPAIELCCDAPPCSTCLPLGSTCTPRSCN